MEALSESRRTFIPGRCSLQAELLANIPFLKSEVPLRAELRCIGHYRAGERPGFQTKTAQKLYPIPRWLESPLLACEPHRKEKTHKRGKPILI